VLLKLKNSRSAIILAGGESRRMGFNKEYLKIDDEYLIHKQIKKLIPLFNEVIVVTNNPDFYDEYDVKTTSDIILMKSPLIGLHAGLHASSNDYNYLLACDMPFINDSYIETVSALLNDKEAYVCKTGKYFEPFHGYYHKSLIPKLEKFVERNLKFQDFIETLKVEIIETDETHKAMFKNLNYPVDIDTLNSEFDTVEQFEVEKIFQHYVELEKDYVITEFPLTLYINNQKYITLLITPTNIKELIYGYMRSEKLILKQEDVIEWGIDMDNFRADVKIISDIDENDRSKDKLLTSGCGVGTRFHEDLDNLMVEAVQSDYTIGHDDILNASRDLNNKSGLFRLTGGVHSCLFVNKFYQYYVEDIGRHNAVDKVVGHILIEKINPTHSYIISSGRISSDMLIKCAVSQIPIVMSRSAPTSLAVKLARRLGITLIGFVRGNKLNVYSNTHRVSAGK